MSQSATATAKPASYLAAMKHFFGLRTLPDGKGQTLAQFTAECKEVDAHREFFTAGLRDNGYPIPPG